MKKELPKLFDIKQLEQDEQNLQTELHDTNRYIQKTVSLLIQILKDEGFVQTIEQTYQLSQMGELAANIQEIHCLTFADLLHQRIFDGFAPKELICVLSCFTNISIPREQRIPNVNNLHIPSHVKAFIKHIQEKYYTYEELENRHYLNYGYDFELQYELCELVVRWCDTEDEKDCKLIYQELKERNIFLGEFIKAILKINNIANELEKICTIQNNMKLLSIIKQIPVLTLKNVATNQSLYL